MGIILFLNKKRLLTKEQRPERPQWVGNQTETRISIENHLFRANQLYMETWKWLYCKGFSSQGPYETLYISSYGPSSDILYTQLLLDKWTGACQIPLSMEFSMQEYWNSLPFPTTGDLPSPGIEPASLVCPALAGRYVTTSTTWEDLRWLKNLKVNMSNTVPWISYFSPNSVPLLFSPSSENVFSINPFV